MGNRCGNARQRLSVQDPPCDVRGDQVQQLLAPPGQDGPNRIQRETLGLFQRDRRRDGELLTGRDDVDDGRTVGGERIPQRRLQVGSLAATSCGTSSFFIPTNIE